MSLPDTWSTLEAEARDAFADAGRFRLLAYSEFMPAPYLRVRPYDADSRSAPTGPAAGPERCCFDVSEYEWAQELAPGLKKVADRILGELRRLVRNNIRELIKPLLADNPAWPRLLAAAAEADRFRDEPLVLVASLALSRTQDARGNVRWTVFGASHEGPSRPFWRSFAEGDREKFLRLAAWAGGAPNAPPEGVRIEGDERDLPAFARPLLLADGALPAGTHTLVTFTPFAALPDAIQRAYLERQLRLVPSPASLIFFEEPRYRAMSRAVPWASQLPLLHLFPRAERGYAVRIPQFGTFGQAGARARAAEGLLRDHRWERVSRDETVADAEGAAADPVAVALFSTDPEKVGLYGKPMARNVQVWSEAFEPILDGPRATGDELAHAEAVTRAGKFGYRHVFPPMRVGPRELFWHLPLIARAGPDQPTESFEETLLGFVQASSPSATAGVPGLELVPRLLDRPGHRQAATLFHRDAGQPRLTTCHNIRKLLLAGECLGTPLSLSLARALIDVPKELQFDEWLRRLPDMCDDRGEGEAVAGLLGAMAGSDSDPGAALTLERTRTREAEMGLWTTMTLLSEGDYRLKNNADPVAANAGKTGGDASQPETMRLGRQRDLERVAAYLHGRYGELARRHEMGGGARVVDHVFRWDTDFSFPWMHGWSGNQHGLGVERNVVFMIPGRNRGEALIMADHYDTAYMEDAYELDRGGDGFRGAAAGADDNYSATAALLLAAEALLPLAQQGKLERDVWLVHLTGEEFPADCLGARAICQSLVQRRLHFTTEEGSSLDASNVRVVGALVLDMIAHNTPRKRDFFHICHGRGPGAVRLASRVHLANERWNRLVRGWNCEPERQGKGRAQRMPDGKVPPPPFAHLPVSGMIRAPWEPRSALFNTDGQIFSDTGVPTVLIIEYYDISRTGYHDMNDTMKNIDLDYAAALSSIAIEAAAETACSAGA